MSKKQLATHLKEKGFPNKITKAFEKIKREKFIPERYKRFAHFDNPIPIGFGQTTSQPYTIAFMLNLLDLKDNQKILEVGSGSGYVLALINKISKNSKIYGIERIKELAENSKKILNKNKNIHITSRNGNTTPKGNQSFDRILVSASSKEIPEKILKQLKKEGTMVCVVEHSIIKIKKTDDKNKITTYPGFSFVPLVGG
jgi:protein-L-isoaspartate(D-aspartate) O-methyltransferase